MLPNVSTVRHRDRLVDDELHAAARRADWATLMRLTFGLDVTVCPNCHGRMRLLSAITDAAVAKRILDHLGVPSTVPQVDPQAQRKRTDQPSDRDRGVPLPCA